MKKINTVFSEIKTPESWKENLYNRIQEEEDMNMKAIRPIRKIAAWAVAAAAVVSVSVITAAATGILNFESILRKNYNDEISASKIEQGDYQPLDASVSSKNFEFTAKAFMGDNEESYVLLEAKVKNPDLDVDKMGITLYSLEENVTDLESYGTDSYESEVSFDEEGNKFFLFKVKTYSSWVYEATYEKTNLMLYINKITCENDKTKIVFPAKLKILFAPEFSNEEAKEVNIGKKFSMADVDCVLEKMVASDYGTKVFFSFTNDGKCDTIISAWENAKDTVEDMMGIDNYEELTLDESPITLIVNGEKIPLINNGDSVPLEITVAVYEINTSTTETGFTLTFDPIDYQKAESVAIKVRTDEGVKKYILKQ